jgi:hypothetical protein
MWPPGGSSARRAVSWPRWRAPIPTPDGRIPRDGLSAEGSDWAVWNGDWLPPLAPSLHGWGSDLRRRAVMSYREGMTHFQESLSQTPRGGGVYPPDSGARTVGWSSGSRVIAAPRVWDLWHSWV